MTFRRRDGFGAHDGFGAETNFNNVSKMHTVKSIKQTFKEVSAMIIDPEVKNSLRDAAKRIQTLRGSL